MTRKHSRLGAVTAATAALGIALTGCAGGGSGSGTADTEPRDFELSATTPEPVGDIDHFSWSLMSEPFSLHPIYAFDYSDNTVLSNVCEALFRWESDLTLSPGLATSYENPDPLTWVFQIREGVKFHDGTDMTARDVVASLNANLDPELASFWESTFQYIDSIEQTGEFEVTVKTTRPDYMFQQLLAASPGVVSSADSLAEHGRDYGNQSTGVNCTGPFKFESWQSGESIDLSRFDDYWDPDLTAKAESMTFVIMNDSNSRMSALQTGEVDGGWRIPTNAVDTLQESGNGEIYFGTNATIQSLIVADTEGPLGDVRVRQALSMALDRDALVQAAAQGYSAPAGALTNKPVWIDASEEAIDRAFAPNPYAEHNIEEAKELIAEAGAEGAEITIASATHDPSLPIIAQAVASVGAEIGLNVTIDDRPANAYTMLFSDPSAREGVDLFTTTWYLSSAEPLEMYMELQTGQFSNYGNWSNEEFDRLTSEALQTGDPAERSDLAADVQLLASEELPWIPLMEPPTIGWFSERITGADPSINYMYYPWAAKIGSAE